jgi:hypothetical protein
MIFLIRKFYTGGAALLIVAFILLIQSVSAINLKGTDETNITSSVVDSLLITNINVGGKFLGLINSLQATIKDKNQKKISGAICRITIWNNNQTNFILDKDSISSDGKVGLTWIPTYAAFIEGTNYVPTITCYCGTTSPCFNEDGTPVLRSAGTASGAFTTNTWINFNQNPFPITDSKGNNLTNPALTVKDLVYWRRNATNNANVPLKATVTTYLINVATGVTYGKRNEGSTVVSERTFSVGNENLIFNHRISQDAPDGTYKIRLFFDVTYKDIPVALYMTDTDTFTVSGGIGDNVGRGRVPITGTAIYKYASGKNNILVEVILILLLLILGWLHFRKKKKR